MLDSTWGIHSWCFEDGYIITTISKNGPFPVPFFFIFIFSTQFLIQLMVNKITDDKIRTANLWCHSTNSATTFSVKSQCYRLVQVTKKFEMK